LPATQSVRAAPDELVHTPFIRVLTYPKVSLRIARSRVSQLKKLGVDAIRFEGTTQVGGLGMLGLGTVSAVVKAEMGGQVVALKVRRTDANRPSMENEVRLTAFANRLGIGPAVIGWSKDLLALKLLEGLEVHEWFRSLKGPGSRARARSMLHRLLNQCRKLDIMGLDHGELSDLRKHVIVVGDEPWIIDFESGGTGRRSRNVTSAAQYLLVGGRVSPAVRRTLGIRSREPIFAYLRAYSKDPSDYNYAKLLEFLKLA
jgi:putative serine/threonine protein kinase